MLGCDISSVRIVSLLQKQPRLVCTPSPCRKAAISYLNTSTWLSLFYNFANLMFESSTLSQFLFLWLLGRLSSSLFNYLSLISAFEVNSFFLFFFHSFKGCFQRTHYAKHLYMCYKQSSEINRKKKKCSCLHIIVVINKINIHTCIFKRQ